MGVYSSGRLAFAEGYASEVEIPEPNTSYYGHDGANRILAEAAVNDLAMFEAIIGNDIQQAYVENAINEGAELGTELEALQEAATGGIFSKLKDFLKKIWEKITGLIMSFVRKVQGAVTTDNKKLVEKFKKTVMNNSTKLKKMKFKWSKVKRDGFTYNCKLDPDSVNDRLAAKVTEIFQAGADLSANTIDNTGKGIEKMIDARKKIDTDLDKDDADETIYKEAVPGISSDSFEKDVHEFFFEDEEELDGDFSKYVTEIMATLTNSSKNIKDLEKTKTDVDKAFSKAIKAADKFGNNALKFVGKKYDAADKTDSGFSTASGAKLTARDMTYDGNDTLAKKAGGKTTVATELSKAASTLQRWYNLYQSCVTKLLNAQMAATSFHIKQCRRVWTQAAAFAERPVKEDALLFDAIGEAADFETDQLIGY